MAFDALSEWLPGVKSLMLLGTGLASAIHVLDRRGLVIDSAVLVDVDPHILQLAEMLIPTGAVSNKAFVCADVREYILADDPPHSDLLIVDVFIGRSVPDGICTTDFLSKCKEKINPGGRFVMNYMVSKPESWWAFRKDIEKVFPDNQILEFGLNKLIIGKVSD